MAGKYETAVRDYFGGIVAGEITACEKMRRVSERILYEMDNGQASADGSRFWQFSEAHAMRHVGFIEAFCLAPLGTANKPVALQPFQRAILAVIFGFVDGDGVRQYREILWVMGRKNGKSTLAGAVQLDLLVNDDEIAPEIYAASNSIDQSKKVWTAARRMAGRSPALKKHLRFLDSVNTVKCRLNDGVLRALSSDTTRLDGLDVSGAIIDELGAMRNADIYDLVTQGTSARVQPLVVEITTCGFVRNGIYDAQYVYATKWLAGTLAGDNARAESFLPFIYELDDRNEVWDEASWIKANPGLGAIKTPSALRANVDKARDDPRYYKTLCVKDFNLVETSSEAWLSYEELHNPAPMLPLDNFDYYIGGIDLSRTTDLTAACALMMRRGDPHIYALHMAWIPETAYAARMDGGATTGRDGVPYDLWVQQGLMRVCPGGTVDYEMVLAWFDELKTTHDVWPYLVGVDPWGFQGLTGERFRQYFGEASWIEVRQGPQTLSIPMQELKTLYAAKTIVDGANPLVEWCRGNVIATYDSNANVKPDKAKSVDRIDVFAAELDAWTVLRDHMDEYKNLIGWEGDGG